MKIAEPARPVLASWLREQGFRLDPGPFVSGAMEARKLIEALPDRDELQSLTRGYEGGIYNGPQFGRVYVQSPEHGVPFMSSTSMNLADFNGLPLLRATDARSRRLEHLQLVEGTTLISCSGTVGRTAYTRRDMTGIWSSQHVMKVVPNPEQVPPGYLHAYLRGRYGSALVKAATYGTIVQHIEPEHIAGLLVPRLGDELEKRAHALIAEAAELRARFQEGIEAATRDLFESAGLADLLALRWHDEPRDLGFEVEHLQPRSMRALNYAPRFRDIVRRLGEVRHRLLGDLCAGGQFGRGIRFARVECQPGHGACLIGQRQVFWLRPEGRWISTRWAPTGVFAEDETVMIAAQGTLGENEVFCKAILVTGAWLEHAYSEHLFRVGSSDAQYPGAYLFAFLRSPVAFRCLRSMSVGSKQQDVHPGYLAELPIPSCTDADRDRIASTVRDAHRQRDKADRLEDEATALVEDAIRSGR